MRVSGSSLGSYLLDYGSDTGPTNGLALPVPLPQLSRKLALKPELLYEGQTPRWGGQWESRIRPAL